MRRIREISRASFNLISHNFSTTRMVSKGSPYDARVLSVEPLDKGKWLDTKKINYRDPSGKDRVWEMVVRTTRTEKTNIDAVSIASILRHSNKPKEIVLIKQFRPPVGKVVIELPAGLIDPEESVESTAVRELLEETGYHGKFTRQTKVMCNDPGLANANMVLAFVDVDLNDPVNANPEPQLEEGEFIETFTLPLLSLLQSLEKLQEQEDCIVDARLSHLAEGLSLASIE